MNSFSFCFGKPLCHLHLWKVQLCGKSIDPACYCTLHFFHFIPCIFSSRICNKLFLWFLYLCWTHHFIQFFFHILLSSFMFSWSSLNFLKTITFNYLSSSLYISIGSVAGKLALPFGVSCLLGFEGFLEAGASVCTFASTAMSPRFRRLVLVQKDLHLRRAESMPAGLGVLVLSPGKAQCCSLYIAPSATVGLVKTAEVLKTEVIGVHSHGEGVWDLWWQSLLGPPGIFFNSGRCYEWGNPFLCLVCLVSLSWWEWHWHLKCEWMPKE